MTDKPFLRDASRDTFVVKSRFVALRSPGLRMARYAPIGLQA